MFPEDRWCEFARLEPEPLDRADRRAHRPLKTLLDNINIMVADHDRWTRYDPSVLVFEHDTGVKLQMRRAPPDCKFAPNRIMSRCVMWMDGMPPLSMQLDKEVLRDLYQAIAFQEAQRTIVMIGTIATLSA